MNIEKFINDKSKNVDLGAIRAMFDKASRMENVISLGIGEPNQDTHSSICKFCGDSLIKGFTHYAPNAGMKELRTAISENGLISNNIYDPESEIIVTNGGMGAFALVMQVILNSGDHVLIQDPQYLNFTTAVTFCGGIPVRVPTSPENSFSMEADTIRTLYVPGKTKMLIINSPNNPTGEVMTKNQLREIAEVAVELDLIVISDEVYSSLTYDNEKPVSIADFPGMKERTVIINSFSKGYAMTGWRIGYAAGPSKIISAMTKVQEYFNSCINTSAQLAGAYALYHPEIAEDIRLSFAKRRELTINSLSQISGIKTNHPKGAFYLFPDITAFGMSSTEFCDSLLREAKVVCIPGSAFGECGEGFIRISYSTEESKLMEGLSRLTDFCLNKI